VKARKGYYRNHPSMKLPKGQAMKDRKTGCRACVRDYRSRTRSQRETVWNRERITCVRHPQARAIRSCFLGSGTRRCSRCHRYRKNGSWRPAALRGRKEYQRKATLMGFRPAWAANRRLQRRLEENKW
jgi:hypothetical protein